jgi:hypothetical protein
MGDVTDQIVDGCNIFLVDNCIHPALDVLQLCQVLCASLQTCHKVNYPIPNVLLLFLDLSNVLQCLANQDSPFLGIQVQWIHVYASINLQPQHGAVIQPALSSWIGWA